MGLATSWAVLAASSPDVLESPSVYTALVDCATVLLQVKLSPARLGGEPLCTGCSNSQLPDAQVVVQWCESGEADAWGEAATSAVLSQYHPSFSTVLMWLANAPVAQPPRVLSAGAAVLAASKGMGLLSAKARVAALAAAPAAHAASIRLTPLRPAAAPVQHSAAVR